MIKRLSNLKPILTRFWRIAALFILFSVISFVVLINRTTTARIDPIPPWQSVQSVLQTGPQEQIGIASDGVTTLLVWAGDAASPNLNILDIGRETVPTRLQLGL